MAVVARLALHAFVLAPQTIGLGVERRGEIERLEAKCGLMLEVRVGPLNRIAEHDDQTRVGQQPRQPLCGVRVGEVVGARLTGDVPPAGTMRQHSSGHSGGEMAAVPRLAFGVVQIEIAHLLEHRRADPGVARQQLVERCGAAALGTEDHICRHQPGAAGRSPVPLQDGHGGCLRGPGNAPANAALAIRALGRIPLRIGHGTDPD